MVGSKGYNSHPYLIDFGLAYSLDDSPDHSTKCYEFKGKYFVKFNTSKFDVYSLGVTLFDLEFDFENFCAIINSLPAYRNNNYDTWGITEA